MATCRLIDNDGHMHSLNSLLKYTFTKITINQPFVAAPYSTEETQSRGVLI